MTWLMFDSTGRLEPSGSPSTVPVVCCTMRYLSSSPLFQWYCRVTWPDADSVAMRTETTAATTVTTTRLRVFMATLHRRLPRVPPIFVCSLLADSRRECTRCRVCTTGDACEARQKSRPLAC